MWTQPPLTSQPLRVPSSWTSPRHPGPPELPIAVELLGIRHEDALEGLQACAKSWPEASKGRLQDASPDII